jgi:hypothetical protein
LQTTNTCELNNKLAKEFLFDNSGDIIYSATPVNPEHKGFYIWYKDSVAADIDTSIISDEHELLYQSVKLTEYKSKLKMYVSVYSACLTVVILFLLSTPFLPDALASFRAGESPVIINNGINTITPTDQLSETEPEYDTYKGITWGSFGYTDIKNNVIYVLLPNGKYSIQESSWKTEEKAVTRVMKINSLDISYSDGTKVTAAIEKVDLFTKGVWYRTRVGEFATIKEAIETAVTIRAEEKSKNFSVFYVFPRSNFKV